MEQGVRPCSPLHIIPHVWFRNTWAWGREPKENKPSISAHAENVVKSKHHSPGERYFLSSPLRASAQVVKMSSPNCSSRRTIRTTTCCSGGKNEQPYVKDAFHRYIVDGETGAVNPAQTGTKCSGVVLFAEAGGVNPGNVQVRLRCCGFDEQIGSFANAASRSVPDLQTERRLPRRGRV